MKSSASEQGLIVPSGCFLKLFFVPLSVMFPSKIQIGHADFGN